MNDNFVLMREIAEFLEKTDLVPSEKLNTTVDQVLNQLGKATGEEIIPAFKLLSSSIEVYLKQFDLYYKRFLTKNSLNRKVKGYNLQKTNLGDQSKQVKIPLGIKKTDYQKNKKATQDFISIMSTGRNILVRVREIVTQQQINTEITIQTSQGLYRIPESVLQGTSALQTVLSTYGANKNSIFSLAYKIDRRILFTNKELKEQLAKYLVNTEENSIYDQIWKAKELYLMRKRLENGKQYVPVFNSKDAEIYNLMSSQEKLQMNWLNLERYAALRASMGGGGGYRTSSLKLGDVGLVQDKMIGKSNTEVNFASFGIIRNNLERLQKIVSIPNKINLTQGLIKMFTEKKKHITDEISYRANEEAKNNIKKYFKI